MVPFLITSALLFHSLLLVSLVALPPLWFNWSPLTLVFWIGFDAFVYLTRGLSIFSFTLFLIPFKAWVLEMAFKETISSNSNECDDLKEDKIFESF